MEDCPFRGRHIVRVENPPLTEAERAALEQTKLMLRERVEPSHKAPVIALLARLANHRSKEKSATEWQMLFEDYAEDLAEFSAAHVQEAIKLHRQNSPFFPASSELRDLCKVFARRDEDQIARCTMLLARDAK